MISKYFIILFSVLTSVQILACLPNEIFIREEFISEYTKQDGTHVNAHTRHAHCRKIEVTNFFQDKTSQQFKSLEVKTKPWTKKEKEIVETYLSQLPAWLKKYSIRELLRATSDKDSRNPASTIPEKRTIVIYDRFFKEKNNKDIIIHEMAHISILDLTENELINFYTQSGWIQITKKEWAPPKNVIIADSRFSVSEDYANYVEMYYSNPNELKKFNQKAFDVIDTLINKREK